MLKTARLVEVNYLAFISPGSSHISEIQFLPSRACFLQGIFHQINVYMNSLIFSCETGLQSINIPVILITFLSSKNLLEYRGVNSEALLSVNHFCLLLNTL